MHHRQQYQQKSFQKKPKKVEKDIEIHKLINPQRPNNPIIATLIHFEIISWICS
jgi:hypothetical protein